MIQGPGVHPYRSDMVVFKFSVAKKIAGMKYSLLQESAASGENVRIPAGR
jgi:hypothetical protein